MTDVIVFIAGLVSGSVLTLLLGGRYRSVSSTDLVDDRTYQQLISECERVISGPIRMEDGQYQPWEESIGGEWEALVSRALRDEMEAYRSLLGKLQAIEDEKREIRLNNPEHDRFYRTLQHVTPDILAATGPEDLRDRVVAAAAESAEAFLRDELNQWDAQNPVWHEWIWAKVEGSDDRWRAASKEVDAAERYWHLVADQRRRYSELRERAGTIRRLAGEELNRNGGTEIVDRSRQRLLIQDR